ncbi:MAG: cell division protein FtsH, partial [Microcystaceae cyanobacterium]
MLKGFPPVLPSRNRLFSVGVQSLSPKTLTLSPSLNRFACQWLLGLALLPSLLIATPSLAQVKPASSDNSLTYGQLVKDIKAGQVKKVDIDPVLQKARVTLKNQAADAPPKTVRLFKTNPELIETLKKSQVNWGIRRTPDNSALVALLGHVLIVVILISLVVVVVRKSASMSGQAMSFGKSRARFQMEAKTGIGFEDVAGIDEAKEELQEVVTFLKQPEKFTAIGAKIPRGVLLIGPPGTG